MPPRRAKPRVVSVSAPTPPKPKLPPYQKGRMINFWHPKNGMYKAKIIAVDAEKDKYTVELRSGAKWDIQGDWVKTRRPDVGQSS